MCPEQGMEQTLRVRHFRKSALRLAVLSKGIALLLLSGVLGIAHANCLDEVRTVLRNDLDLSKWPPYRSASVIRSVTGVESGRLDSIIETQNRTIATYPGGFSALAIDGKVWTGPSPQGPWSAAPSGNILTDDAARARLQAQQVANLSEAECLGEADLEGKRVVVYRYLTKTDPDPSIGGHWFGGRSKVFLDPATRRVLRWEQSDAIGSFSMGDRTSTQIQSFMYDPTIKVSPP